MIQQQTEFFREGATPYAVNLVSHQRGHRTHDNTRATYRGIKAGMSERGRAIVAFMDQQSAPLTDRQIMRGMGFSDMNAVRPRISELIDGGVLREVGNVIDETTGKVVRLVEVVK